MRAGYAWKRGPFEQIDELGVAWFADRLAAEGLGRARAAAHRRRASALS